jgi:hypothetical protein
MENIVRAIARHFVFVLISFISVYLLGITFGAEANYFSWGIEIKIVFATFAHVTAAIMHGYWYENR